MTNTIKFIALALLVALGFLAMSGATGSTVAEKPNFVIVLVDDLGERDVGPYGNTFIDTPNIDALARQGTRWSNAYAAAPICSPTRAALLTGKNPARVKFTGHITAIHRHRHPEGSLIIPPKDLMIIPKEEVLLPEAIAPAGYRSISIGKWHVGGEGYWPTDMGFDENVAGWTHGSPPSHFYPYEKEGQPWNPSIPTLEGGEEGEYLTDRLTDEAIEFITRNRDKPFLVYLSHYAVHTPLQAPEELVRKYERRRDEMGNTEIDPVYAAMTESVDEGVGRILETLDDLGLAQNTVVIFASDNGALERVTDLHPYRAGKGQLYEGGTRVPFIMRWPERIAAGAVSDTPTKTEDIYATIVDLVGDGAQPGAPLDGRSLVADFAGEQFADADVDLHWYYPHYSPHGSAPGASIRSGRYKLIEFYDPEIVELYDLVEDPGEREDLSEQMPGKVLELQGKLRHWIHEVDPIMHTYNPKYKANAR